MFKYWLNTDDFITISREEDLPQIRAKPTTSFLPPTLELLLYPDPSGASPSENIDAD